MHLVRSEDHPWLLALTAPPHVKRIATRLRQNGVSAERVERAVYAIEHALADSGPLTRDVLRQVIEQLGIEPTPAVLKDILGLACLQGLIVRGPLISGQHAFVLVRDWLGKTPKIERDKALAELARRYLGGHAPADECELARWAGLPLSDIRFGLGAIAGELHECSDGRLVLATDRCADPPLAPPKLLGPWDPVLLGWRDRTPIIGARTDLISTNGIFHPLALVGGRAAGRWRIRRGRVDLSSLHALPAAIISALAGEAADVERFLGDRA